MARMPLYKKRDAKAPSQKRLVNIIKPGSIYGEWTVVGLGLKKDYLKCKCSCGVKREVHAYSLKSGKSVSCGHLRKQKQEAKEAKDETGT